jgi:uncharacterized protein YbjT (DUF2867 family)
MANVTIVGGTGLIGARVTARLRALGHAVRAAAPSLGVDTVSGRGLDEALSGTDIVLDASNPGYGDVDRMVRFFRSSARNLAAAERRARVKHHVLLSVVGAGRVAGGYFLAKAIQERVVEEAGLPFTIVRSTPFFEYLYALVDRRAEGGDLHVPPVLMQPVAADDAAEMICDIVIGEPDLPLVEIGGPDACSLPLLAEEILTANEDPRRIVVDPEATYFGARLAGESLVAFENPRVAPTRFDDWLRRTVFLHPPGRREEHPHMRIASFTKGDGAMNADIDPSAAPSGTGCAECLAEGSWWFHLRRCAACGHVGCCDSSPNRHATAHFHETGHPIIRSFEPGEDWFWDYRTRSLVEGPELAPPASRPVSQPAPGPAGAVPSDWVRRLHEQAAV